MYTTYTFKYYFRYGLMYTTYTFKYYFRYGRVYLTRHTDTWESV